MTAQTTVTAADEPVVADPLAAEAAGLANRRYVPGDEIARGGGGRITRAHDRVLDRVVALKTPLDAGGRARARLEAQVLARLQHPSIVPIYDTGIDGDGLPFYAMKLVAGRPLRQAIADATTPAARLALLPHVVAIAEAIAYAHGHGVIHRDLKPGNVLVGDYGETIVIDWGLAKVVGEPEVDGHARVALGVPFETVTGQIMGTPAYMPLEQATAGHVDERSDVYAIGAILYHLLAGAAPYADRKSTDDRPPAVLGPPTPIAQLQPHAPADLVAIVEKAMARDPAARYPSANELARDLVELQTGRLVSARVYSPLALVVRWLRRHRFLLAASAVVVAVVAGAVALTWRTPPAHGGACATLPDPAWTAEHAAALERAFQATGLPYAAAEARSTIAQIDRQSGAIAAARVAACEAAAVTGDADRRARQDACLDQRHAHLAALIEILAGAERDPEIVRNANRTTSTLESVDECSRSDPPVEPVDLRNTALHDRITAAEIRLDLEIVDLRDELRALVEDARLHGTCTSVSRALLTYGHAMLVANPDEREPGTARRTLEEAAAVADGCGHDLVRARALLLLIGGHAELDAAATAQYLDDAAAVVARVRTAVLEIQLLVARAAVAQRAGDTRTAIEYIEAAAARPERTRILTPDLAKRLLATLYFDLHDLDRASALTEDLLARVRPSERDDLDLANVYELRSKIALARGDRATAIAARTEAIRLVARQPDYTTVPLEIERAEWRAIDHPRDALAELTALAPRVAAADDELQADLQWALATTNARLGNHAAALAAAEWRLAIFTRKPAPAPHPAKTHHLAATSLIALGRTREAVPHLETALAAFERTDGSGAGTVGDVLDDLGDAEWRLGQRRRAIDHLERARVILGALSDDNLIRHRNLMRIAEVAWQFGDRAHAREMAEAALVHPAPEQRREAADWLARHPR